jgi:hypothetical protein
VGSGPQGGGGTASDGVLHASVTHAELPKGATAQGGKGCCCGSSSAVSAAGVPARKEIGEGGVVVG